jgi:GT2 family glycosyltransferase
MTRLQVDGRFFRLGGERIFLRLVTYGPFPPETAPDHERDFARIAEAGFHGIRLYQWADRELLDAAESHGLHVFAGHQWPDATLFLGESVSTFEQARVALECRLAELGSHPALAGVFVANEIPSDLVRWMGPAVVLHAVERLIAAGRKLAPQCLWAYSNYPSTEYLEPGNADFTAMNVYLEQERDFRAYLQRLHHVAGDRPVVISEFGLDSRRNGPERQAETIGWGIRAARALGTAGMTLYAWSDHWWNAGAEVEDWDFGLVDRQGREKPALAAATRAWHEPDPAPPATAFSVIVCCRNGRDRIGACLCSLMQLRGEPPEILVVDDGSTDGTGDMVARDFPGVRLLRTEAAGLSAARNAGAAAATRPLLAFTDDDCEADPDWLVELAAGLADGWDAVGGPNLAPPPADLAAAVITAAPGAASHVMLDDHEAEHVPGCNLALRREAYFEIGGFDRRFRTAGDDVDFCWRLRDAGMRIGFAPNAVVWHHRRQTIAGFLRQQNGYGKAEKLLRRKHPDRFSPSGDAMWRGVIYSGAPVRAEGDPVIYHGPMGLAGYQGLITRMQPLRPLAAPYDTVRARALLQVLTWLAPRLRSWALMRRFRGPVPPPGPEHPAPTTEFSRVSRASREAVLAALIEDGWHPAGATEGWDLEKDGIALAVARERFELGEGRLWFRFWGAVPPGFDPSWQKRIGSPASAAASKSGGVEH